MSWTALASISLTPLARVKWARAENHQTESHKAGHGAHVHGAAKLSIALETGRAGTLLLESPADSIIGFEHEAKTPADKKTQATALDTLKNKGASLFVFDSAAKCAITTARVEIKKEDHDDEDEEHGHDKHEKHGEHSEVEAEYSLKCSGDLKGTTLSVSVGKSFPKIKTLQVQVLGEKSQSASDLKGGVGNVKL